MSSDQQGALLLKRQLADLNKNPPEGFSAGLIDEDNLFKWEIMVVGPPDTFYEGGLFKAHLYFPKEYPQKPPKMRFISEFWHPNGKSSENFDYAHGTWDISKYFPVAERDGRCYVAVHKDGEVCISILHEPGEDKYGYEKASERWLPIHTVETILMSVISMISDPNDESPANVDAAKDWREDYNGVFKKKVKQCVRKSQEEL